MLYSGNKSKLTAAELLDDLDVKFDDEGTNSRRQEELFYGHFIRYLREVEGKLCSTEKHSLLLYIIIPDLSATPAIIYFPWLYNRASKLPW